MHTRQNGKHTACLAGLLATTLAAFAAVHPLATPPPVDYVDTESSTNLSLAAWRDYTPPVKLTLELEATPTNAVHVAFGHDLDGDGDLAPEETEYIVGYDCGEWFTRDERTGKRSLADSASTNNRQPSTANLQRSTFNFQLAKDPAARWDLAKVTTRGKGDSAASIAAQLTKPHFYIVIR